MQHKTGPRAEYRQHENERVKNSISLAEKFRQLKALKVDLSYFNSAGVTRNSDIKYTVNLAHAKSFFRVDCFNYECVGGDFDLSKNLAHAVATHQASATGELCCQGWLNKSSIDKVHCNNVLRYKFSLAY